MHCYGFTVLQGLGIHSFELVTRQDVQVVFIARAEYKMVILK